MMFAFQVNDDSGGFLTLVLIFLPVPMYKFQMVVVCWWYDVVRAVRVLNMDWTNELISWLFI